MTAMGIAKAGVESELQQEIVEQVLRARHSSRAFRPEPLPGELLNAIFTMAGTAPSNCNTQPWRVEVASGATRDRLSAALIAAAKEGRHTPDFPFDEMSYTGVYGERRRAQGALYFQSMGIARDDRDGRDTAIMKNLDFFGAPHVALLFMPDFGGVRVAADVGMYAQNLLIALTAHGIGSCSQTILGFFAETVRETLAIDPANRLLFGISFGYNDEAAPQNRIRMPKAPLPETTYFR